MSRTPIVEKSKYLDKKWRHLEEDLADMKFHWSKNIQMILKKVRR